MQSCFCIFLCELKHWRVTAGQTHSSRDWLISCFIVLQEVRRVWLGYMSQCDSTLGQKLAAKCQAGGQM